MKELILRAVTFDRRLSVMPNKKGQFRQKARFWACFRQCGVPEGDVDKITGEHDGDYVSRLMKEKCCVIDGDEAMLRQAVKPN